MRSSRSLLAAPLLVALCSLAGPSAASAREDVHLRYEANVVVLETDAAGTPLRERHQDVMLSFVRPDASGSLFDAGTSFEVRRRDGAVQVFARGERSRAQGFLRAHGVLGARLDGPATASLERGEAGSFRVRYRVPIASFAPGMPANGRAAHSEGQLEGEAVLEPGAFRAPLRHSSRLALRMHGTIHGHGVARSFPWSFRSSVSLDQHSGTVHREVASR